MKRRVGLWALVGFLIVAFWVLVSLAIPMWREPVLLGLARLTCPIVNIGFALHFGVKWYARKLLPSLDITKHWTTLNLN